MDLSNVNTVVVCGYYMKGEIERIPQIHIDRMLNLLTYRMKKKSVLGEQDPAVQVYIKTCLSDMKTTVDRYLQLTYAKRESVMKCYFKPDRKERNEGRHAIRAVSLMSEYYEDIADYIVGTINYEGHKLDIYYNVPIKTKHSSLTCFHTNPKTMNQYYFKNLHDILPSDELREQFMLQTQPEWSRPCYESAD
jgi:hypothetical protein